MMNSVYCNGNVIEYDEMKFIFEDASNERLIYTNKVHFNLFHHFTIESFEHLFYQMCLVNITILG